MRSGILNVYKEPGFTSFDVVAKLRGILHIRKIGHTGTLDPAARGVLPVCIGRATKAVDLMANWTKTYIADMQLGIRTDSQDMTGQILERNPVSVSEDEIQREVASFFGPQDQIPPMYSARKVGGKRLYHYARQGIELERRASHIVIYDIQILSMELPHVIMEVTCSKGTYIRTLCSDIGDALGCGASMAALERIRVGDFDSKTALRLDQIQETVAAGRLEDILYPVDAVFADFPALKLPKGLTKAGKNGAPIAEKAEGIACLYKGEKQSRTGSDWRKSSLGQAFRVYLSDGVFLGIYVRCEEGLRLKNFFYEERP